MLQIAPSLLNDSAKAYKLIKLCAVQATAKEYGTAFGREESEDEEDDIRLETEEDRRRRAMEDAFMDESIPAPQVHRLCTLLCLLSLSTACLLPNDRSSQWPAYHIDNAELHGYHRTSDVPEVLENQQYIADILLNVCCSWTRWMPQRVPRQRWPRRLQSSSCDPAPAPCPLLGPSPPSAPTKVPLSGLLNRKQLKLLPRYAVAVSLSQNVCSAGLTAA